MAALQTDARLFGLDLSGLGAQWLQAIKAMGQWPLVRWLTPSLPVRVHMPNGDTQATTATEFEAVVLPDDLVLHHQVALPVLPPAETQAALALAVQTQSPFAADDLLWVARPSGNALPNTAPHDVVITSRPLVQAHLDTVRPRLLKTIAPHTQPEIWAHVVGAPPFVLPGFGEARRQRSTQRRFAINLALCLVAFGLAVAAAVAPTLQLRMRAIDAVAQHTRLQQQVAPALALRESLVKTTEQMQALAEVAGPPVSAVQVLDLVTRALPDDTSLLTFALNATETPAKPPKVVLTGNTGNAAALMQKLGNQPGLRDIKALTAATKPLGADKESFSIEATLDLASIKP